VSFEDAAGIRGERGEIWLADGINGLQGAMMAALMYASSSGISSWPDRGQGERNSHGALERVTFARWRKRGRWRATRHCWPAASCPRSEAPDSPVGKRLLAVLPSLGSR